jgi:hypothetical protein
MGPDTKPMCLNKSEFDVWMKCFGDWLEGNNLDFLLAFNNDILVLDSDQKPLFSFPGYAMDRQTVCFNFQLQLTILKLLSQHVWSIVHLPSYPCIIDGMDDCQAGRHDWFYYT